MEEINIKISENGPYIVKDVKLIRVKPVIKAKHPDKWERNEEVENTSSALCRCGKSNSKPFCDGTHHSINFDGKETADRAPTKTRRVDYKGDNIVMTDDKKLCYHAGFCVKDTTNVWKLIDEAKDSKTKEEIIRMVRNCPSGRLEYFLPPNETPIEENLDKEIALVEDGPLWVRGNIPIISSDGETYEVRNRVALCRCGASENKPLCDGSHSKIGFKDPE